MTTLPDTPTDQFLAHRELLFSVVYGMLGSVADSEDVLQETWLGWDRRHRSPDAEPIEHPRSYLVRIAVNAALERQAAIRSRRETYPGPWLPEPLPTDDGPGEAGRVPEEVSLALLVVLETLSPLERAAFVLHEVFGFRYAEVGQILGRSPAATRQLGHRARQHVRARRPRFPAEPQVHQELVERFVAAALGGDLGGLVQMLAPDATMTIDGGGTPRAPRRPVQGRDRVVKLIAGLAGADGQAQVRFRRVNHGPAAVLFRGTDAVVAMVLDLAPDGQHIGDVYAVVNPDKLAHLTEES